MRIKILGDCYYCVSGMPISRPNHAVNIVKMGLAMIHSIKYGLALIKIKSSNHYLIRKLKDCKGGLNIRIGVNTGNVLCGIIGSRKWQYDVWSADVDLANLMEQTGLPGWVKTSLKYT